MWIWIQRNKKTKESLIKKPCMKRISTASKSISMMKNFLDSKVPFLLQVVWTRIRNWKCKECDYECTEMRKPKEAYVKKPSLKEFSINSIETYKCNECEYEIKEIRKLKNQSKRNHIWKGFLKLPKLITMTRWRETKCWFSFWPLNIRFDGLIFWLVRE